jgi:curli biogenesis system outer membrane secretion channel CsgG
MRRLYRTIVALLVLSATAGCAKQYVVTQPLEAAAVQPFSLRIGPITESLPADATPEQRPRPEELDTLVRHLQTELAKKGLLATGESMFQVEGTLVAFTRGSGAVRFLVGFGAGSAKATLRLHVVDTVSGTVVFAGNFSGSVSNWAEAGDQMFRRIARDFAKELTRALRARAQVASTP